MPHSSLEYLSDTQTEEIVNIEDFYTLLHYYDNEHGSIMHLLSIFWNCFKTINPPALATLGSSTFTFNQFLIVFLLNKINSEEEDNLATILIIMLINILCTIGMSAFFAISITASKKVGELRKAETIHTSEGTLSIKRQEISMLSHNGFYLSTIVAPPVIAGLFFSKPILMLCGQNEDVAQIAQDFLRIYSYGVPGLMLNESFKQILLSFGHTKMTMLMALSSFGIGAGLATWLGFGGLGVDKFGATGVAIGFAVETYIAALFYSLYLVTNKRFRKYEFFKIFSAYEGKWQQFKDLIKISSSTVSSTISEVALSASTIILSDLNNDASQTAAMININTIIVLNNMISTAFGQTNTRIMNEQIGEQRYDNTSVLGKYGIVTTMLYTIPMPLFFAIAPGFLITSNNPDSIKAFLKTLAPIMFVGAIVDAGRNNLGQQLKVLGDLNGSTIVSITGLGQGITASAFLGLKTKLGDTGIAIGYLGGITLTSLVLWYRWLNRIKPQDIQKIDTPSETTTNSHRFFNQIQDTEEREPLAATHHSNYGAWGVMERPTA